MENENENNNEQQRSITRCRRTWSEHEEETLLSILEEFVADGKKRDNGTFEHGTHEEICKRMKNKIPEIALTVKQVINKMKRCSTKLSDAVDMMNISGFGWDDAKKCVISDYLEKHYKVGNHINKEFKEFERYFW